MTSNSNVLAKLTAIAVLVGALAVMALFAVGPYARIGWVEDEIEKNNLELLRLRKQLARETGQQKDDHGVAGGESDAKLLLGGDTTGISGANLQSLMNELVLAHGGTASSFQILPPETEGTLVRIPMSLSINVDIDGLRDIVYGIETGTPLVFIDDVAIKPKSDTTQNPDPHFLGPLDVTLQVSAFELKKDGT